VTDKASITAAADAIGKKHDHIDVLVNNAGIMIDAFDKAPSDQTIDAWRKTFDTNLFGVVEVTQALLPLLHKAEAGRIVNVSSKRPSEENCSPSAWRPVLPLSAGFDAPAPGVEQPQSIQRVSRERRLVPKYMP
jgi:short-subunit dehydrogenase involved in D-alanine esterification of teichoic acids